MFKTEADRLFKIFEMVKNILDLDNELSEVVVNRNQVIFECSNMIEFHKFDALHILMGIDPTDITTFEGSLYIAYRGISKEEGVTDEVNVLLDTIEEISNHVCQCPILEMRISRDFIKVYLDKPNIKIKDVAVLDEIFSSEGVLQTGEQRAYVLYVR